MKGNEGKIIEGKQKIEIKEVKYKTDSSKLIESQSNFIFSLGPWKSDFDSESLGKLWVLAFFHQANEISIMMNYNNNNNKFLFLALNSVQKKHKMKMSESNAGLFVEHK